MHVFAIVHSPGFVCCRYRLAAFRADFQATGHDLTLVSMPSTSFSRIQLFHKLRGQTVVLQRTLLLYGERLFLRRWAKKLIYDFDDAVYQRDSFSPLGMHDPRQLRRFAAIVRESDVVVAGNCFLADQAVRWTTPSRVHVIPTCVDPALYPQARHAEDPDMVRLVWVGSSSTLQGLQAFAGVLDDVGRHIPRLHLKVICDRFLTLKVLPVLAIRWSEATEATEIASSDIGISWIPDDSWSRGKCGLKILQYMAAGLPVVANPVGVHRELVVHSETGYLAETAEQWLDAVRRLAGNPNLRRAMGAAGRQRLEKHYSVAVGGRAWTALLAGLESQSLGKPGRVAAA